MWFSDTLVNIFTFLIGVKPFIGFSEQWTWLTSWPWVGWSLNFDKVIFCFETWSHRWPRVALNFLSFLSQPPKCWNLKGGPTKLSFWFSWQLSDFSNQTKEKETCLEERLLVNFFVKAFMKKFMASLLQFAERFSSLLFYCFFINTTDFYEFKSSW